jgi:hypothetical protein
MDIRQIVVVSDLHCGCRYGLCPPKVRLDDGSKHKASAEQKMVWGYWKEFWGEWVPRVTRGEPYAVVCNGDAIDGDHHRNNTHITNNLADQKKIAEKVLARALDGASGLYMTRGTDCHVGQGGQDEEDLAKSLGAAPNAAGQYSRHFLRLQAGRAVFDIQHHISSPSPTTLKRLFDAMCAEAGAFGHQAPDVCVRSHIHRFSKVETAVRDGHVGLAITTPGWQLKTPYTFRLMRTQAATPQIGGLLLVCGDEEIYERHFIRNLPIPEAEVL